MSTSSSDMGIPATGLGNRRNGLPPPIPYTYQGEGRSLPPAEAARRLRIPPQVLLPPEARLDVCEAIDGPSPEWHNEAAQEITDLAIIAKPKPSLATSRAARAAVPAPTVIKLRPVREPVATSGHRRFWRGPLPPSLAARLTTPAQPSPGGWCERCGYKTARCACPGGPRGGAR